MADAIVGATGTSYTVTEADIGKNIYVVETATNDAGSVSTPSNLIGPITNSQDPGLTLLQGFDVWLRGGVDLVAGATSTVTPSIGGNITIGATTGAEASDPTITANSITATAGQYLSFNAANTPDIWGDFVVVLAIKAPTRATDAKRTFWVQSSNDAWNGDGLMIYSENALDRVVMELDGVGADVVFGNLLPNIYNGALWVLIGRVQTGSISLSTFDGSTLTTQSTSRTATPITVTRQARLFGPSGAPGEAFACAYKAGTLSTAEMTDIAQFMFAEYGA